MFVCWFRLPTNQLSTPRICDRLAFLLRMHCYLGVHPPTHPTTPVHRHNSDMMLATIGWRRLLFVICLFICFCRVAFGSFLIALILLPPTPPEFMQRLVRTIHGRARAVSEKAPVP